MTRIATLVLAASAAGWSAAGDLDGLANLGYSERWSVSVDGDATDAYTTTKPADCKHGTHGVTSMSFCGVDFTRGGGPVTVRVRVAGANRLEVRPKSGACYRRVLGESVELTIDHPQHVVVLADGSWDDALVISVRDAARGEEGGRGEADHYFGPGVHRIGERYRVASGETVFLAEHAVVVGSLWLEDVHDVRIHGAGILYGGDDAHREDYRVIGGSNADNVVIEGVTVANAPGWIFSFWDGSENLVVRGVTTVGAFRYNTDGVQTGADGLLVEDCFLQTNDDTFSLNGGCRNAVIRNNVLWNLYNGGVFMLGWGEGAGFRLLDIRVHDNVVVRAGGCCPHHQKAPFSLKLAGRGGSAENISFERVRVEELLPVGQWINVVADEASDARLTNWRFEDVSIDAVWSVTGAIRGPSVGAPARDIVFDRLTISGRTIASAEEAGLMVTHAEGVRFSAHPDEQPPPRSRLDSLLKHAAFDRFGGAWKVYNDGKCRVFLEAGRHAYGDRVARVAERRSPFTGLRQDVTEALRAAGPGRYDVGALVRGVDASVDVRVTLKLTDGDGVRHLTDGGFAAADGDWTEHATPQPVDWRDLEQAEWILQSANGSTAEVVVGAAILRRVE